MLSLFRPSSEVVKEGRIFEKSDTYKTICGCHFVVASQVRMPTEASAFGVRI
jgi:hypothetical protein